MKDFDGLVAIVTGGASGIGLATALELADRGARVVALDINARRAARTTSTANSADVSDRASVERAIAVVAERQAGIDIVINNAGIGAAGTVDDNDDAEWARVLDINVVGMARVTAAALAVPAALVVGGDRQHLLGRGAQRPAPARALLGVEGRRVLAHPRDGDRPPGRRHPGQRGLPRAPHRLRGSIGCCRRPRIRMPNAPPSRRASRWVGWSAPRRSPTRSATWRARSRPRRPAPSSTSTAGCRNLRVRRTAAKLGSSGCNASPRSSASLPRTSAEYERLHAEVWPAVLARIAAQQHPQLLDLPLRRAAVLLLRVRRRRLRGRPRSACCGPRDAALVDLHRPVAAPGRRARRGRMVARAARGLPRGLSACRARGTLARAGFPRSVAQPGRLGRCALEGSVDRAGRVVDRAEDLAVAAGLVGGRQVVGEVVDRVVPPDADVGPRSGQALLVGLRGRWPRRRGTRRPP